MIDEDDNDTLLDSVREENAKNAPPEGPPEDQPPENEDEPDDAADDADHGDEDDAPPQRQSRGSERIRRQAELNRQERERAEQERERAEAAERRAEEAERRAAAAEAAAQERERARSEAEERAAMEAMSEEQRATYLVAKNQKRLEGQFQQLARSQQDGTDRVGFNAILQANPQFKKYQAEVERMAREVANAGGFLSREVILDTLIGRDLRNGSAGKKQREEGRERIQEARGKVPNRSQRSNVADRGGKKLTLAQRMERDNPII